MYTGKRLFQSLPKVRRVVMVDDTVSFKTKHTGFLVELTVWKAWASVKAKFQDMGCAPDPNKLGLRVIDNVRNAHGKQCNQVCIPISDT